jgi:putative ATP-dependent endonuclease of OLD family
MFARCWLLVEGESEAWLLPELARICGYELAEEGVAVVEYAQSGLGPAIRTAVGLGVEWHVLTDGDEAGAAYLALAREYAGSDPLELRATALRQPDLERFLWRNGYAGVYRRAAGVGPWSATISARRTIRRAIEAGSKPTLALEVLSAVAERGEEGVPAPLRSLIETCVTLAREAPARLAARRDGG